MPGRLHGPPLSSAADHGQGEHEALAAAATIATPALWVAVVVQAPAGSARGLVLAVGWVGIASLLSRRPSRKRS